MENKSLIDFMVKFNQLNETNQKYIIAIQQALAQGASTESTYKEAKEK